MHLYCPFSPKPMSDVDSGELFSVDLSGYALAIAMQINENDDKLMCVLLKSEMEAKHPCWITLNREHHDVLSYGSDWCLDVGSAPGTYPGNYSAMEEPGTLAISNADTTIRAGGDGTARMRSMTFSLRTFAIARSATNVSDVACVRDWSIWLNEAERVRPGATPLFTHTA